MGQIIVLRSVKSVIFNYCKMSWLFLIVVFLPRMPSYLH